MSRLVRMCLAQSSYGSGLLLLFYYCQNINTDLPIELYLSRTFFYLAAVSLRAVRLSSRQKINFSETWHTLVRTGSFFIHFKAAISQYSGLNPIKTRYASKTFYTPLVLCIFIYKDMQISNQLIA